MQVIQLRLFTAAAILQPYALHPHGCPSTSTDARFAGECEPRHAVQRTPMVLPCRKNVCSSTARHVGRHSASTRTPGRPFFICTGTEHDVERAGFAQSAVSTASSSPVMSSTSDASSSSDSVARRR